MNALSFGPPSKTTVLLAPQSYTLFGGETGQMQKWAKE